MRELADRWPVLAPAQPGLVVAWRTMTTLLPVLALLAGLVFEPLLDGVPPRTPLQWVAVVVALAVTVGATVWSWQAIARPVGDAALHRSSGSSSATRGLVIVTGGSRAQRSPAYSRSSRLLDSGSLALR